MNFKSENVQSVHLTRMPKVDAAIDVKQDEQKWQRLMELRDEALRVLEGLRRDKVIASNQESCLTMNCCQEDASLLDEFGIENFAALCIVSEVRLQKASSQTTASAQKSEHKKCQRCWNYRPSVGTYHEEPDLCTRCVEVLAGR
jgi:isoleucyl-tRNA synthetase